MARSGSVTPSSSGELAVDEGLGIARVSIVDRAIELLRNQIKSGAWQVGDRLPPESELTRKLGISRAALREAVRALVHAGLLVTRQGAGTYVVAVDETAVALDRRLEASDIEHVLEVRRGLDVEAVRLACRRRTVKHLKAMERVLKARRRAAEAGDEQAFARADVEFHLAVAASARNELLLDLYQSLSSAIRRSVETSTSVAHAVHSDDDHDELLRAISDRDEESAVRVTSSILDAQLDDL